MSVKTVAIVPSAGSGKRLGLKTKKPFVPLGNRPLVFYALNALNRSRFIDAIIVAAQKSCVNDLKKIIKKYAFGKVIKIVAGGKTRFESVRNCIDGIPAGFDVVLIHDGARPFPDDRIIGGSIRMAKRYGGCVVAVPVTDTIKLADKRLFIKRTLDRSSLYAAQTPQAFRRSVAERAYGSARIAGVTDDAILVEKRSGKVKILAGSPRNIKVTTKEDLKLAELFLRSKKEVKI